MSIYTFGFLPRQFYLLLCLTKSNTQFVFFSFDLLFYFCTLFIKAKKNDIKKKNEYVKRQGSIHVICKSKAITYMTNVYLGH